MCISFAQVFHRILVTISWTFHENLTSIPFLHLFAGNKSTSYCGFPRQLPVDRISVSLDNFQATLTAGISFVVLRSDEGPCDSLKNVSGFVMFTACIAKNLMLSTVTWGPGFIGNLLMLSCVVCFFFSIFCWFLFGGWFHFRIYQYVT